MTEQTHAPLPYDWTASATAAYGNAFHAYLTDANGRKIAAIWGKAGEKEKTANLLMTAANCHADLLAACKAQHKALDVLLAMLVLREPEFMPSKSAIWPLLVQGTEAIKKAEGRT